jgi:hypothetical protein
MATTYEKYQYQNAYIRPTLYEQKNYCNIYSTLMFSYLKTVLWICIGFNADPDPALNINADQVPGFPN